MYDQQHKILNSACNFTPLALMCLEKGGTQEGIIGYK